MAILAFSRKNKEGDPTAFEGKIKIGVKKHTFRMNFSRKVGQCIHFYSGHPRVANSNAQPFEIPEKWAQHWGKDNKGRNMPLIAAIEKWEMAFVNPEISTEMRFTIGEMIVSEYILGVVSYCDGFDDSESFVKWLHSQAIKKNVSTLAGQLTHWNSHTVYDSENAEFYKPLQTQ